MAKVISQAVIRRLPRYYRYLGALREEKVERISSQELSHRMNVTASQIRQDLNNFGGFGQQGYGYNVDYLYKEIGKILGLGQVHNIVIIGAGNLASALVEYKGIEKHGFRFVGLFDNDPGKVGTQISNLTVMSNVQLAEFVANNEVEIGTIAVPKPNGQEAADLLVANGVKALWNFAHVDLKVPDDVTVENVHLSESLMKLSYNYNKQHNDTHR